jgi:hypothetical protein
LASYWQRPSTLNELGKADTSAIGHAGLSRASAYGLIVLLCVAWSAWHWLRLDGLLYGDSVRWMFEARRAANGELIYRDFASMYPPLGIWVYSTVYRWFGATFAVTNALTDLLSTLTVIVTWRLALRFLDDRLALALAVVFACLGATNGGTLALFSLMLYTPAILLGAIGLGLTIISALDLAADNSKFAPKGLLVLGVTIALLSKLEHGAAACITIAVLAGCKLPAQRTVQTLTRWAAGYLILGVVSISPSAVAYTLIARAVGADNLFAGVSGYGIPAQICPLWPNGLGLLGAMAALGLSAAFIAAITLFYARPWRGGIARTGTCFAVMSVGVLLWVYHLRFALADFRISQPSLSGIRLFASYCLSMSGFFCPFMWSAILLLLMLVARVPRSMRAGSLSRRDASLLLVLVPLSVLASRGLFGSMFGNVTAVHQAAYSLLVPLAPYLLLYAQELVDAASLAVSGFRAPALPSLCVRPSRRAWTLLAIVGVFCTAPRLMKELSRPSAPVLNTLAGPVYMADPLSRAAYEYVCSHTRLNDRILELPNGGGLSFATHRLPTTYSTQFSSLLMPQRLRHVDAELVRAHPPELVFTFDNPNLGAMFGLCAPTACMFPRLVWRSDRMTCDPTQSFEAVEFVRANYETRARFGRFVVLSPRLSS